MSVRLRYRHNYILRNDNWVQHLHLNLQLISADRNRYALLRDVERAGTL